jgi:hypothetical protein
MQIMKLLWKAVIASLKKGEVGFQSGMVGVLSVVVVSERSMSGGLWGKKLVNNLWDLFCKCILEKIGFTEGRRRKCVLFGPLSCVWLAPFYIFDEASSRLLCSEEDRKFYSR